MIEFNQVSVRRDGRVLFADASFQLHPKQKVGLTGNNGTGKSSLFAVLLGELGVDAGTVSVPDHWQIGHMAQEVQSTDMRAIDYVLTGDAEWYELNSLLHDDEQLAKVEESEIAHLYQRFDEIDGYRTPTKASQVMTGLGFAQQQHQLAVAEFSGGWRMRLNLARTLMCRADVLLLDEPTNHLDLDAILWLEDWIAGFDGLVLLISHDQSFLDACVGHILHIEQQSVTLYTGNYSQFVRIRSERLAQQQKAFEKQQATKAHLEDYIRRFRAKATKAKQAQSRIKQLERMTELSAVVADNPFSFRFYPPTFMSSPLIAITAETDNQSIPSTQAKQTTKKKTKKGKKSARASIGYDGTPLLTDVKLQITPDTRLGLLGMNGAGKSTLIKALVGELPLLTGHYQASDSLKIGYFNQHQMDSLDNEATPLTMLRRLAGQTSDVELRAFLGSFDFRGDRIDTACKLFSGGERARLTLALIVWQHPNVLVLDEPTNHLDLQMRQALTLALQGFEGAVVLVSHDRELIANVCDQLYLVHDGKVEEFTGDIADYGKWLKESRKMAVQNSDKSNESSNTLKSEQNNEQKSANSSVETQTNLSQTTGQPNITNVYNATNTSSATNNHTELTKNNLTAGLSKEELRKFKAEQRKLTSPIRKRIENAEQALEKISEQLANLEEQLADTGLYDDGRKSELMALLEQQTNLQQGEAEQEEHLMEAMEELEEVENHRS